MRFKVPQNIDMQDRILGPLTMVQFIYAVVGGAACYAIYMSALPRPIAYFLIIPVATFVAAMIFLKINERPFLNFLMSVIEFMNSPKQRIWHHQNISDLRVEVVHVSKQTSPAVESKKYTRQDFHRLAEMLDKAQLEKK